MPSSNTESGAALTSKVPQITPSFWVLKLLTTGMGEAASDYLLGRLHAVGFGIGLIDARFGVRRGQASLTRNDLGEIGPIVGGKRAILQAGDEDPRQRRPQIGHIYGYQLQPAEDGAATEVTSFYDWSSIDPKWREAGIFPVISEGALRATLGILDRTVRRGNPQA